MIIFEDGVFWGGQLRFIEVLRMESSSDRMDDFRRRIHERIQGKGHMLQTRMKALIGRKKNE